LQRAVSLPDRVINSLIDVLPCSALDQVAIAVRPFTVCRISRSIEAKHHEFSPRNCARPP
jgi:hypothetical protein